MLINKLFVAVLVLLSSTLSVAADYDTYTYVKGFDKVTKCSIVMDLYFNKSSGKLKSSCLPYETVFAVNEGHKFEKNKVSKMFVYGWDNPQNAWVDLEVTDIITVPWWDVSIWEN